MTDGNGKTNGSNKAQNVNMHMVPAPGGGKLVLFTAEKYLGSVTFDVADKEALKVVGDIFQQFCAQQVGGIQIAGANAVPGMRTSG